MRSNVRATIVLLLAFCIIGVLINPVACTVSPGEEETPPSSEVKPEEGDNSSPAQTETATEDFSTLRQLADAAEMEIGTYLYPSVVSSSTWKEIVSREFNLAVLYDGLLWMDIEPHQGQFDFTEGDKQVLFAQSNDMTISSHLVAPTSSYDNPQWVIDPSLSREELTEILGNHIVQVMSHYKGQINAWFVVEEVYVESYTEDDFLYEKFGYDYVDLAYQIARETDPDATLIYNGNDNCTSDGIATQVTGEIVQRLKSQGLIDGVGLEMHLQGDEPPDKQDVIATMQSYGVPVYVTELDVNMARVEGTQEERYEKEAEIYRDMLAASLESGVCRSFSVWGIQDKYSWLEAFSAQADATMYDDYLRPKPAYYAIFDTLEQHVSP